MLAPKYEDPNDLKERIRELEAHSRYLKTKADFLNKELILAQKVMMNSLAELEDSVILNPEATTTEKDVYNKLKRYLKLSLVRASKAGAPHGLK